MNTQLLASIRAGVPEGATDRRAFKRKFCKVSGLLFVPDYTPMQIKTLDISTEGIALLLPQALPDRTVCNLSFNLFVNGLLHQFATKVEISNTVFLRSEVRVGCRFVFLRDQLQKTLADFMR